MVSSNLWLSFLCVLQHAAAQGTSSTTSSTSLVAASILVAAVSTSSSSSSAASSTTTSSTSSTSSNSASAASSVSISSTSSTSSTSFTSSAALISSTFATLTSSSPNTAPQSSDGLSTTQASATSQATIPTPASSNRISDETIAIIVGSCIGAIALLSMLLIFWCAFHHRKEEYRLYARTPSPLGSDGPTKAMQSITSRKLFSSRSANAPEVLHRSDSSSTRGARKLTTTQAYKPNHPNGSDIGLALGKIDESPQLTPVSRSHPSSHPSNRQSIDRQSMASHRVSGDGQPSRASMSKYHTRSMDVVDAAARSSSGQPRSSMSPDTHRKPSPVTRPSASLSTHRDSDSSTGLVALPTKRRDSASSTPRRPSGSPRTHRHSSSSAQRPLLPPDARRKSSSPAIQPTVSTYQHRKSLEALQSPSPPLFSPVSPQASALSLRRDSLPFTRRSEASHSADHLPVPRIPSKSPHRKSSPALPPPSWMDNGDTDFDDSDGQRGERERPSMALARRSGTWKPERHELA